jgi:predicted amidohydrolase YtcJ
VFFQLYPQLEAYAIDGLANGMEEMNSNGITSCVEARNYWGRGHNVVYDKVAAAGNLTVKVDLSMWIYPQELNDTAQIEELIKLYDGGSKTLP